MMKIINKFKIVCFAIATLMISFSFVALFSNVSNTSIAKNNQAQTAEQQLRTIEHSIFIHSPTYSVVYQKNIYFYDEFDKLLKIYDLENSKFNNNYISLSAYGDVINVSYQDSFIFVLTKNLTEQTEHELLLTIINLPNFKIETTLKIETDSLDYSKISVCLIDDAWYVSLTPTIKEPENTAYPAILLLKKLDFSILKTCTAILDETVLQNLFEFKIIKSEDSINDLHLIFVYDEEISFFSCTTEEVSVPDSINIDLSKGTNFENLDTTNNNIEFLDVNTILINNKLHFLITYKNTNDKSAYSNIYECIIDNVSDQNKNFTSKLSIQTANTEYVLTSNGYVVYPLINEQEILYNKISYDVEHSIYSDNENRVSNPNVNVEYRNNFDYFTVNKKTNILSSPWDSTSILEIDPTESAKDVLIIGDGKIEGENALIGDYLYCLFTTVDKNIKGFIKTEDLTAKTKLEINQNKKQVKVQPNTNLYSLPTTIVNENITPTLKSEILIEKINENSKIEVLDLICGYKSHDDIMLKVKVNDDKIGYIEYDKILKPSESVDFVITNASIKEDGTNVYLESNTESPVIYVLDKGYRVRINGARNTDSGYTYITFNDEYGNEKNGYILTDTLTSDSWTVMQIIGCVLIAINIGLLILILRFKKNHIGANGSKYIDNEK